MLIYDLVMLIYEMSVSVSVLELAYKHGGGSLFYSFRNSDKQPVRIKLLRAGYPGSLYYLPKA